MSPLPPGLEAGFYQQLVKVCQSEMEGGVRELGSSASASSNERAFHVICILSAATDMLVWASRNDTGEWILCVCTDLAIRV